MKIIIIRKALKDRHCNSQEEYETLRLEIDMSANEFMELPELERKRLITMIINETQ